MKRSQRKHKLVVLNEKLSWYKQETNRLNKIVYKNKLDKVKTEKVDISVIIPVYNTALYLKDCLDSILNQTLKNIEIICIDDGSTDNSNNILKEYARNDKRLIVIKQPNMR